MSIREDHLQKAVDAITHAEFAGYNEFTPGELAIYAQAHALIALAVILDEA